MGEPRLKNHWKVSPIDWSDAASTQQVFVSVVWDTDSSSSYECCGVIVLLPRRGEVFTDSDPGSYWIAQTAMTLQ